MKHLGEGVLNQSNIVRLSYMDEAGIVGITAYLQCGHTEDYSSEHGGWDEAPGIPSLATIAGFLHGMVDRHDCKLAEQRLERARQWQQELGIGAD